jgi:hydroxymethylpyrimidine/phosphomethylpyrimidine kinase
MEEQNTRPVVLTVAGFDPSGGAGVLADIKTFAAFDCYGVAAITSLTFQNTEGVRGALHQDPDTVRQQLSAITDDFRISAIKTGMLPTRDVVREVVRTIKTNSIAPVVVDPVLTSTSGFNLVDEEIIETFMSELLPLATLVTPNIREAERLSGVKFRDTNDLKKAGEVILQTGCQAVLITGGDVAAWTAADLLVMNGGSVDFKRIRVHSRHTHGTGCTLSAALACLLSRGYSMIDAVACAKDYIVRAITTAPGLGHGHGPLNHFPPEKV